MEQLVRKDPPKKNIPCCCDSVNKRVGCRGTVSVHTGGIDNWWKLMKDSVPNNVPTTKGIKVSEKNLSLYSIFPMAMGNPTWLAENNSKVYQATVLTLKTRGRQKRKHVLMHVAAKVKPSLSETELTFRCGETTILHLKCGRWKFRRDIYVYFILFWSCKHTSI